MTTFPALTPATRAFTPGEYPHTPFTTYNGLQNRVRHSNVMLSSSVRLSFIALTEADMLSILSHYQGQFGGFDSFTLPSSIWSGVTTISDYELTDYRWRYTDAPIVDDVYCGRYNVELTLETVPPEGAFVNGAELAVIISLSAGTTATTNGIQQSITFTLAGGVGSVSSALGIDEEITLSLVAGAAEEETDPDFSSVSLLLHMDGSNGSTTFTDSSSNARTVTANGNAQISTAQSKFGGASALFDGTGDYLEIGGTSLLSFPGAFTVQSWVRPDSTSSSYQTLCEIGDYTDGILMRVVTDTTNDSVYVNGIDLGNVNSAFTAGTWSFVSLTRNSSNLVELSVDGTILKSATITGTVNSTNAGMRIARNRHSNGQDYAGYIDDLRITKGVARPHNVPIAPFPDA